MSARRFAAIALVVVGAVLSAQPAAGIQRARWLQGCWEASLPARTVEEIWTRPRGGSMIGISRTIRDGKLTEYELVVLREQGDRLAYVAHPSAQTPATFLSTTVTSTLVFENPAHDFPQQIGYRRDGDGLLAWISGSQNGKPRRAEFPYTRISCDASVDGRPIAQRPARYAVRRINAPAAFVTGRAERRNIGR